MIKQRSKSQIAGRFFLVILALGLFLRQDRPIFSAPPGGEPNPQITLLPDGLELAWQTPDLQETIQADGSVDLTLPGFAHEQSPGLAKLPVASVLLALPPEGSPELTLEETVVSQRPFSGQLAINPQPDGVLLGMEGNVIGGAFSAAEPLPRDGSILRLEEAGTLRGVRLARLTFSPVQIEGDQLKFTEFVRAAVQFNAPAVAARSAAPLDRLQTAVAGQVINPSQLTPEIVPAQPTKPAAAPPTAFIEVAGPGMTAVTYSDLQVAGFPVGSANPNNLQLWYDGEKRPLEWFGDGDALFEPGESFRFYAAPWFDRWMANDLYRLTAEVSPGSRISGQGASPDSLTAASLWLTAAAEQNNQYTPDCLCGQLPSGRDGDRWVWEDLRQPGRPSASYAIELPYVNKNQPAELTLWAIGFTAIAANPDHRLDLAFNGAGLGSLTWDGKTAVTHTVSIPGSSLQTSSSLALTVPSVPGNSIDGLWLDAFAVRYAYNGSAIAAAEQLFVEGAEARRSYTVVLGSSAGLRLYDVTQPASLKLLNGAVWQAGQVSWGDPDATRHQYLITNSASLNAPAAVRLPAALPTGSGADYLVISHGDFLPALGPLVALRQSQGLAVSVVDVQAIYDAYGSGRLTPEAIRSNLAELYQSWSPRPTYVLLVGDGTSDPKQYREDSQPTWLPPYLADADPWIGEVAADNRFVTVDGDDWLPDMLIGRLPVNSLAEAQTVVAKIVGYEASPFLGDWNGRVSFVADDTDIAGNFTAHSLNLEQTYVTAPWQPSLISYAPPSNTETAVQAEIKQSWQNGQGLLIYTGHSSIHQWGAERFFHLDDVPGLANGARLPVVLEMTCFTGSFQQPFWDTLDEALLRHPNGGAVAVWGATGLGVGTGHDALASGFLDALMVQNELRLGTAVLAGKVHLLTNRPANQDLLDTFTLLGDPATQYNTDFWPGLPTYLPLTSR